MGDTFEDVKYKNILEYVEKIYEYENQYYKELEEKSYRFLYFLLGLQGLLAYLFTNVDKQAVSPDVRISILFPLILIFIGYYYIYRALCLRTFSRPNFYKSMYDRLTAQPNVTEYYKKIIGHYNNVLKKNSLQNKHKAVDLEFCEVIILLVLYSTLIILIFVFLNIDSYIFYSITLCQALVLFGSIFIALFILFNKTLRVKE